MHQILRKIVQLISSLEIKCCYYPSHGVVCVPHPKFFLILPLNFQFISSSLILLLKIFCKADRFHVFCNTDLGSQWCFISCSPTCPHHPSLFFSIMFFFYNNLLPFLFIITGLLLRQIKIPTHGNRRLPQQKQNHSIPWECKQRLYTIIKSQHITHSCTYRLHFLQSVLVIIDQGKHMMFVFGGLACFH